MKHDDGNTFSVIQQRIEELGYDLQWAILSPHKFGVPQVRTRVYIVAIRKDLAKGRDFSFPKEVNGVELDVRSVLDEKVDSKYDLNEKELAWLEMWEEFLINVNTRSSNMGRLVQRRRKPSW
mgnify:FL=1